VGQFYVRNNKGENVPLLGADEIKPRSGLNSDNALQRYRSAQIQRQRPPGYSSDQATAALAEKMFSNRRDRWKGLRLSGMSYQERKRGKADRLGRLGFSLLFGRSDHGCVVRTLVGPAISSQLRSRAVFGAFAVLWLRRVCRSIFSSIHGFKSRAMCIANRTA